MKRARKLVGVRKNYKTKQGNFPGKKTPWLRGYLSLPSTKEKKRFKRKKGTGKGGRREGIRNRRAKLSAF